MHMCVHVFFRVDVSCFHMCFFACSCVCLCVYWYMVHSMPNPGKNNNVFVFMYLCDGVVYVPRMVLCEYQMFYCFFMSVAQLMSWIWDVWREKISDIVLIRSHQIAKYQWKWNESVPICMKTNEIARFDHTCDSKNDMYGKYWLYSWQVSNVGHKLFVFDCKPSKLGNPNIDQIHAMGKHSIKMVIVIRL